MLPRTHVLCKGRLGTHASSLPSWGTGPGPPRGTGPAFHTVPPRCHFHFHVGFTSVPSPDDARRPWAVDELRMLRGEEELGTRPASPGLAGIQSEFLRLESPCMKLPPYTASQRPDPYCASAGE